MIAYVFPQDRLLQPNEVAATRLTRINYAFANLKGGRLVPGFSHDQENLAFLVSLKQLNPQLQILISVGGWSWSGRFSDMALTTASRATFIQSAIEFIRSNHLDGLDIDWEYPNQEGAGNPHRPEDKRNFTALIRELRTALNTEKRVARRPLLLTIAAGAQSDFIANTEMKLCSPYLDSVNLMSYDYYVPSVDKTTGHHAPLYPNPRDPKQVSAQTSVDLFLAAGVPARKLVLGVPFYGHAWSKVKPTNNGLFQPGKNEKQQPDYKAITTMLGDPECRRTWDATSAAPSLYCGKSQTFVSYDDAESIAAKCQYIRNRDLGGIMFWEYSNDPSGALLQAISEHLR